METALLELKGALFFVFLDSRHKSNAPIDKYDPDRIIIECSYVHEIQTFVVLMDSEAVLLSRQRWHFRFVSWKLKLAEN
jgi:hypothetical protein